VHRGIPVASVSLALLGLAQMLRPSDVERALENAERLRILDMRAVDLITRRYRGYRGVALLRALVIGAREPEDVREELERRFAAFCRRHRLPRPVFNTLVEGFLVDVLWREKRLIIELDSWQHHSQRGPFERDRARDATLQLAGYMVLRITWRRLTEEPEAVAAMIRQALRRA
jgi:very-short-patch-repair endonuclease